MPAINTTDLINAKLDADTIAGVATSTALTVTDRLGNTKNTLSGMNAAVLASAAAVQGSLGYLPPVAYVSGISLTLAAQTVGYSGQTYAPILSALPFTTSGTFETVKFRLIQGVSGADLAAFNGAVLVGANAYQTQDGINLQNVSVRQYGAIADGGSHPLSGRFATLAAAQVLYPHAVALTDEIDWAATQGAINANANGSIVNLPRGNYRINRQLTIPSNVTLRGQGRNFGTTLTPVGCYPFNLDGTNVAGGWVFRIAVEHMLVSLTLATGADAAFIKAAYNVRFRNVFFFDQPVSMTNGITVAGSNNIIFDDVIGYGTSVDVPRFFNLDGTTAPVSVKLINCDIEVYNRGIRAQGEVVMDIVSSYMERCIVDYSHEISAGVVNVYGGTMGSVNGYGVNIAGDNLNIYGTDIDPYQGGVRGGPGIIAASAVAFRNVNIVNVPRIANAGFLNASVNYLTLNISPTPIAAMYRKTVDFQKTLADNVLTSLVKLANFDAFAKIKLTLTGSVGLAFVSKQYDFIVSSSSTVSSVTVTAIVDTSGSNFAAVMSLTLTPDVSGGFVTVAANADTQGALANGQPFSLIGQMEITALESGIGGVYLL